MTISSFICHIRLPLTLGLFSLTLGSSMGCQSSPPVQNGLRPPSSNQTPALPTPPKTPLTATQLKPITFSLTVDNSTTDLKIKQGDFVRKGQVIADPGKQRLELETKQQTLQSDLNAMTTQGSVSFSLQAEEKNIATAQAQYDAAQAALQNYEQNSPWTDFARDNLPLAEEEVELTRLQKNLKLAQKNLAGAKTTLAKKQAAIENFQADQASAKTRLQQELLSVEQKLAALKPIQSSHTGTITKIDVAKPTGSNQLNVTVKLLPGNAPQLIPPPLPTEIPTGTLPTEKPTGSASDLVSPSIEGLNPVTPNTTPLDNPTVE